MELRDYILMLRQSLAIMIGLPLIFTLAAIAWATARPVEYQAIAALTVDKPAVQNVSDQYQYDKYYALQASGLYADTLGSWTRTPSMAQEAYRAAGLSVPDIAPEKLGKIFNASRRPISSLLITIVQPDRQQAERLVKGAVAVIEAKAAAQKQDSDPSEFFVIINDGVTVGALKTDPILSAITGLIAGLVLALTLSFFRAYLRGK